jgi:parvulin-like peptidyl-prolyl isomerase
LSKWLAPLCALSLITACHRVERRAPAAAPEEPIGYDQGTWRLDSAAANAQRFAAAHILISHRELEPATLVRMWPPAPLPNRTRAQALALAQDLLKTLRAAPERFDELARTRSEDQRTSRYAGRLGVVSPPELPDAIADALYSIDEGQISHIVESEAGFNIVKRLALPPDDAVSASEIFIGYAGTDFEPRLGRTLARDRAQALALASRVARMAQAAPERFTELVHTYSDATSALLDGDLGAWKPSARVPLPMVTYGVGQLAVGQVSDPIETRFGFAIVKRDDRLERKTYDATEIIFSYEGAPLRKLLGGRASASREEAMQRARETLATLAQAPEKFEELALEHCRNSMCLHHGRIGPTGEGRGEPAFEVALRELKIGEITSAPIETAFGFHLLRREDPMTYVAPSAPTVDDLFRKARDAKQPRQTADFIADRLQLFSEDAIIALALPEREAAAFSKIMLEFAGAVRLQGVEALPALNQANRAELEALLGGDRLTKVLKYRDEWSRRRTFVYGLDPRAVPRDHAELRDFFDQLKREEISQLHLERKQADAYAKLVGRLVSTIEASPSERLQTVLLDSRKQLMALLGRETFIRYHEIQSGWLNARRPSESTDTPASAM